MKSSAEGVLLRKQEPRAAGGRVDRPGLLLSQENRHINSAIAWSLFGATMLQLLRSQLAT